MKRLILFFLTGISFSCNNEGTTTKEATKDSAAAATTTKMNYPYTIEHPDYWEMGSSSNTMAVLTSVKAFQDGNVAECVKYFGDSVRVQFDGLDKKLSHDSLQTWLSGMRSGYKSMDVKMNDWESVVSKDKKEEWVTLWYRQKWEDIKGQKDSADFVDDLQLKDSKIIRLSEYTRKLH